MRRYGSLLTSILVFTIGVWVPSARSASAARSLKALTSVTVAGYQLSGHLVVDKNGNIYSATRSSTVVKFSPTGRVLAHWDGLGTLPDAHDAAGGITLDKQGNVLVVDTSADAIVKLSPDLQLLAKWGGYGQAVGQLIEPQGIALDHNGNALVADKGNGRVQRFSTSGKALGIWGGSTTFRAPEGIAIAGKQSVYVVDDTMSALYKFSPAGKQVRTFDVTLIANDVAADTRGVAYVADTADDLIVRYGPKGVKTPWVVDTTKTFTPVGLAVSPQGRLYASECPGNPADPIGCRIVEFSSIGKTQTVWRPAVASVAIGTRVDIGGYSMLLRCIGQGSPTVVLDAGAGYDSTEWFYVQPKVAQYTHVCAYDRTGDGHSDARPTSLPWTGLSITQELHALLQKAGVPGPYILVGHSWGGVYVRLYAESYPNEVVGLGLVDSVNENEYSPDVLNQYPQIKAWVDAAHALSHNSLKGSLGTLPVMVLTQNAMMPGCASCTDASWLTLQDEIATASSNTVHVVATRSNHMIPYQQPALVVQTIRELVDTAQSSSHQLPSCGSTLTQLGALCR